MILPPFPDPLSNGYYDTELIAEYALRAINAYKASVSKRQSHRKFNDDQVCEIRKLYAQHHYPYKQVYRLYPMSEVTFINIKEHRGAYK